MQPAIETHTFPPDGDIPNNALPLVLYRGALAPALQTPAACQALFARNDWRGNWVDGIFDYWHFHVTGHEVLGCVAGEADVGFGGDRGVRVVFAAGDVVVIPGGVGHRRLSEKRGGFTVVGGYPPGQNGTIARPGDFPLAEGRAPHRRAGAAARRSGVRARGAAHCGMGPAVAGWSGAKSELSPTIPPAAAPAAQCPR